LQRTVKKAVAYGLQTVGQLDSQSVNFFLSKLPLSTVTRSNIRRELLTLWKFAFEQAYTDEPPIRIIRIRVHRKPPRAWSKETLLALLDAAETSENDVSSLCPGLCWCHVLPAWIAISFDTGLRFTDVLNLRSSDIRNGCVTINASKTGKCTVRRLSDYALNRIGILLKWSPDGTLFRHALTRRRAFTIWRRFLDEQKVEGTARFLRRSSATYVEQKHPGSAPRFLDHSNPMLARLHYLDLTLLDTPEGPEPLR
jgi:integrase